MRVILALTLLASCVDYEPDVGPLNPGVSAVDDAGVPVAPPCEIVDTDPSTAISFSRDIRPMIQRAPGGCMFCHANGRATSGFDIGSYTSLRRGGVVSGARIVIDGDPCNSILPNKIGPTPPFGSRMPNNGPPYFSSEDVRLVRDWIAEGALNN
jgi:hypothetical protein